MVISLVMSEKKPDDDKEETGCFQNCGVAEDS